MSALLKSSLKERHSAPTLTLVERVKPLLATEGTLEWTTAQATLLVDTLAVADTGLRQRLETLLLQLGSVATNALLNGLLSPSTRSSCASILIRRGRSMANPLSQFVSQHQSHTPELGWVAGFITQMWGA